MRLLRRSERHRKMLDWCIKGGSRGYITTQRIDWDIGLPNSGWTMTIEAGREFESSVPRWLWWAWSPDDPRFLKSALVHDALLERGYKPAFADSQWIEAALSEHAPEWKTKAGYIFMVIRRMIKWRAVYV